MKGRKLSNRPKSKVGTSSTFIPSKKIFLILIVKGMGFLTK